MQRLYRKRIVLGVGGGIAAYKSAELVRRLLDHGAEVRVVMTRGGSEFITPLTMQALSGHPVHLDLLDPAAEAAMGHIELAKWADLVLIAPATADLIARLAQGIADDLLTTLVLATDATVALAPAMNQAMWRDPATQANTQLLVSRGLKVFGPASGSQACGDVGLGRMLEPNDLAICAADCFQRQSLTGKHVLITAGPTQENIDPVRYITNHSSGKMGFALAEAAAEVVAAGERASCAAQHDHLDGGVAFGKPDGLFDLVRHRRDDGVELLGPVQRDGGDGTVRLVQQGLELWIRRRHSSSRVISVSEVKVPPVSSPLP